MQANRPITMALRALDTAQMNYATIEKEILAIYFRCQRFHAYVYGKEVQIQIDHKPLISIMSKPIHKLSARMKRM